MYIKQVSIFVENRKGSIAEVISILGNNNINIRALSVADTADFGILRLIVNNSELAYSLLKENGYTLKLTDVIGIKVPDEPNGLANILTYLHDNGVEITYIYAFIGKNHNNTATVIIKTQDLVKTYNLLQAYNVELIANNETY